MFLNVVEMNFSTQNCKNIFQEQRFTDVTLAVEDQSFKAHKLVLSACSPYFKHLLTSNECRHPVICLKDIPHHHVALLLQYMYLGQIAVKREELNTFLRSADHLKIRGLAMNSPTSNIPRYVFLKVIIKSQSSHYQVIIKT